MKNNNAMPAMPPPTVWLAVKLSKPNNLANKLSNQEMNSSQYKET
jgi:hypothetical protein